MGEARDGCFRHNYGHSTPFDACPEAGMTHIPNLGTLPGRNRAASRSGVRDRVPQIPPGIIRHSVRPATTGDSRYRRKAGQSAGLAGDANVIGAVLLFDAFDIVLDAWNIVEFGMGDPHQFANTSPLGMADAR